MDLLRPLRPSNFRGACGRWRLTAYEIAFRAICRHRQGPKPNVLLFCSRRGGSTWVLNTLAAHPRTRYVGRPFLTSMYSFWRREIPSLSEAAEYQGDHAFENFVHFEGEAELRFREFARKIVMAERHIYPMVRFWAPYFHRVTDRVIFQMTNVTSMIEWFAEHFPVATTVLLRHPISTALSIMEKGWPYECEDFLLHRWFVETHLDGPQVDLARRVLAGDSLLAKHVLDWTLKMLLPVRAIESSRHPDWPVITYEHTVVRPDRVLEYLARELDFPEIEAMRSQIRQPSRTVTAGTADKVHNVDYVVKRWRKKVPPAEEQELMRIPAAFGIEVYRPGRLLAADRYLPGDSTDELERGLA
jgi:hypothetical protein